jgi:cardiolipin synthase A/B
MFLLNHRNFLATTILVAATCSISGCGRALVQPQPYVPTPVSQAGATLDWGKYVKTQALNMIQHSQTVCHLDIYELGDPDILKALEDAHQRGVDVRVVVDSTESHSQAALPELRRHGVSVYAIHISQGISHLKMLVTDGTDGGVLIGGMNFGAASWANNDGSVYFSQPSSEFETLFRWDWQRAQGHPAAAPKLPLPLVTDRSISNVVEQSIKNAHHTISMEAFDLSDANVVRDLVAAAKRGVEVVVLLDANQTYNSKSATTLRSAGVTVRFYRQYNQEWMHAKILDVDDGQTFIIGSANFSHQAYTYNHEADIVLNGATAFDQSLEKDLSIEIARGTDYPKTSKN